MEPTKVKFIYLHMINCGSFETFARALSYGCCNSSNKDKNNNNIKKKIKKKLKQNDRLMTNSLTNYCWRK